MAGKFDMIDTTGEIPTGRELLSQFLEEVSLLTDLEENTD